MKTTTDHSRADAGEALKDVSTKGKHSQGFERKENFVTPEFKVKAAAPKLPPWLVAYVKALKAEGAVKAYGRMQTDDMYTRLKPGSDVLAKALRESTDKYHGEVAKTVGAYGVPVAGALGLGSIIGGNKNEG